MKTLNNCQQSEQRLPLTKTPTLNFFKGFDSYFCYDENEFKNLNQAAGPLSSFTFYQEGVENSVWLMESVKLIKSEVICKLVTSPSLLWVIIVFCPLSEVQLVLDTLIRVWKVMKLSGTEIQSYLKSFWECKKRKGKRGTKMSTLNPQTKTGSP